MQNIPVRHINAKQKEPDLSGNFNIRDVKDLLNGKDLVQELHRHDYFYILALKKGKGNHEIDFASYKVTDNSIFFLRPGQVHQLTLQAGSTGYLLQFNPAFYFPKDKTSVLLLRKASNKNYCQLDTGRFKKLLDILIKIYQEDREKQDRYFEVIKASLGIFLIELVRNSKNSTLDSKKVNPYIQERLDEFLELLETNISDLKSVSQYADMMHLTSYQLNAITKTGLGKTCSEVINEYIILESKRYLLATSNQVNQIAEHLGYDDISYFIRFFKRHTGQSPEVFRKNFK
jgi:AraC family transcriptional regulator, transcriptional activator of pobA